MVAAAAAVVLAVAAACAAAAPAERVAWFTPAGERTVGAHVHELTPAASAAFAAPVMNTFTQKVDHFDATDSSTFSQRYSVDDSHWKPGGPAFIFLSGEAPMEFFRFQEASALQWAYDVGAVYISLEHRYYGKSIPTPNYSSENLRFLSSQQALADAAEFLASYNSTREISDWVVFGCSYSGALSSWFRLKYPQLVVGSVAPSGPVFANTDYTGYYQHFADVAPAKCSSAVSSASNEILSKLGSAAGRKELTTLFSACEPISEKEADQYYFLLSITEAIGGSDQFNNPHAGFPLNKTCNELTNASRTALKNWAALMAPAAGKCNDFNEESGFLAPMRDATSQDRSWFWQKCTEFGFFKPTTKSIFFPTRLNLAHQTAWCEEIFEIKGMLPHTEFTNAYYGGYDLHSTNVMFTNGEFDPWHLLSINKANQWGVTASTYAAGHCAPMTAPQSNDPASLTATRAAVKAYLNKILGK